MGDAADAADHSDQLRPASAARAETTQPTVPTVTDDGTQCRETGQGAIRRATDLQLRVIRNVKPRVCTARGTIERQDPMRSSP